MYTVEEERLDEAFVDTGSVDLGLDLVDCHEGHICRSRMVAEVVQAP